MRVQAGLTSGAIALAASLEAKRLRGSLTWDELDQAIQEAGWDGEIIDAGVEGRLVIGPMSTTRAHHIAKAIEHPDIEVEVQESFVPSQDDLAYIHIKPLSGVLASAPRPAKVKRMRPPQVDQVEKEGPNPAMMTQTPSVGTVTFDTSMGETMVASFAGNDLDDAVDALSQKEKKQWLEKNGYWLDVSHPGKEPDFDKLFDKHKWDWAEEMGIEASRIEAAEDIDLEKSQLTQNSRSIAVYRIAEGLLAAGELQAPVLDYGAGLGQSKQIFKGREVKQYEPYPRKNIKTAQPDIDTPPAGTWGTVVNSFVLNVVPEDVRMDILAKIGALVMPGGHAVIGARGTDVMDDVKRILNGRKKDPNAYPGSRIIDAQTLVTSRGTYQHGFTKDELAQACLAGLGGGFEVVETTGGSTYPTVVLKKS